MGTKQCKKVIKMKTIFLVVFLFLTVLLVNKQNICSFSESADELGPKRLVIITGKATIINHPELGMVPDSGGTIIFQKAGCSSCFIGTTTDIDGNYKVLVGDGKYQVIVRNPSSPEVDLLAPNQARFIDTGSENSPKQVFNFDIKIKLPR